MRLLLWFIADRVDMIARPNFRKHELLKWGIFFILLAILGFLYVASANAQVTVALSPVAKQQFFSTTGVPLASGCVNTYITGTSTPLATYVDGTGASQNSNPIILDGGGFANIWLTNASYRFVVVAYDGIPGNKCAAGITQYTVDAINAYAPISTGVNLFLLGQASDPAGTGGEMVYRNDIPCFRFFTTFWDCVVRLTDTQTLTNKTLTSPTINTPTITTPTVTNGTFTNPTLSAPSIAVSTAITQTYVNDTVAGTTLNFLAMLSPTLGQAGNVKTWCSAGCGAPANAEAIGICVSNCTTSGNAQIAVGGVASCAFDGATTFTDYVGVSQTSTGKCTDLGTLYPAATQGQLIGRVLSTNAGVGTYPIVVMTSPEVRSLVGAVAVANFTAQSANIGSTALFTPTANGFFRFSCDEVVSQAATTSSTLPQCNLAYTDGDSSVAQSNNICATSSSNLVGQLCGPGSNANSFAFFAKSGVSINYSTSGYASVGATPMQYAVHVRLEGPL